MSETFHARNREEWRNWLMENFQKKKLVWLMFPKKSSGIESVSYNDAVEEALCFGWIDSTLKAHDESFSIQRYSVRNPKSTYSQLNKERIKWLHKNGLIHESVMKSVEFILDEEFVFPEDILTEIQKDAETWKNYQNFSDSYKRIRIAYIDIAREYPEHYQKRLNHFLAKTKANKLIIARGSEKHY